MIKLLFLHIIMKKTISYFRLIWIFSVIFISGRMLASTPSEVLETLLSSNAFDQEKTALCIWDLAADAKIISYNADVPLIPASVMKCVTTAALGKVMPYDRSLTTKVYIKGKKKDNLFRGQLIVSGCGDPSLGDGRHKGMVDFPEAIAQALCNKGITAFEGSIVIDDSFFAGPSVPPSWVAGDLNQSYGTGCHALNFEGNASGKKAVANPGAVFIRRLVEAFEKNGLQFTENNDLEIADDENLLLTYDSPQLGALMRSCMFRSDNLYAESFLRLFGTGNGTDGSGEASALLAMQHWNALNYPMENIEIIDGSGLSRDNRLTADFLGLVLKAMNNDPEYVSFFPLTGEEGTVKNFMKDTPLQGYMALKTGSMNGIQSYAGYLLDEEFNPTHIIVVMSNNLKNRSQFRSALSNFFLALFRPSLQEEEQS